MHKLLTLQVCTPVFSTLHKDSESTTMSTQHLTQAVMFADISGSSKLYARLGNLDAKRHIDETLEGLKDITHKHEGHVVKTIGDEIMARFDSPELACNAAIGMQQFTQSGSLAIRIGLSYGDVLLDEQKDIFGSTVNDAADVAHIARARQIVITDSLEGKLRGELRAACQAFDQITLKGSTVPCLIYRLQWENSTLSQNATVVMSIKHIDEITSKNCLWLSRYGDQYTLTPEKLPFTLGRDADSVDLHINSARASREHCVITYHRGKYVLKDHSTNGTYIKFEGAEKTLYIRREETPLNGTGYIGMGRSPEENLESCVHFKLNQVDQEEDA